MGQKLLHHASHPNESLYGTNNRPVRQLVWVLITILLLLFGATSYVYWAKLESVWPIFR